MMVTHAYIPIASTRAGALSRARAGGSGFTLMELLVAIVVIVILLGILISGLRLGARAAKRRVAAHTVASLKMGVEAFRNDFGFLPPLVDDQEPLQKVRVGSQTVRVPHVIAPSDLSIATHMEDLEFLRGKGLSSGSDNRYSVYSLSYYLMGSLDSEIDGVDGPGFGEPQRDGTFRRIGGRRVSPFFEPSGGASVAHVEPEDGRIELRDPGGVAYRYYRWEHGDRTKATYPGIINELPRDWNIPELVAEGRAPMSDPELSSASYAIVAAGPNGLFGTESLAEMAAKLGMSVAQDDVILREVLEDNVVEVGSE